MGSFNSTCCISNLPISVCDPVRFLFLTQTRRHKSVRPVYSTDLWVPRTWPLKAFYNDYGSIENWETGPMLDVILEGFQKDLIEMEVGKNEFHDVAIHKTSTFEQILEASWEGRLTVSPKWGDNTDSRLDTNALPVSLAMIREDVWQELIKLKMPHWRKTIDIGEYTTQITKFLAEFPILTKPMDLWARRVEGSADLWAAGHLTDGHHSPFYLKLYEHFMLLQGYYTRTDTPTFNHKPLPPEFAQVAIEFSYICDLTYALCYVWRPSYPIGSQTAEHKFQYEYHRRMAALSKAADKKAKR